MTINDVLVALKWRVNLWVQAIRQQNQEKADVIFASWADFACVILPEMFALNDSDVCSQFQAS